MHNSVVCLGVHYCVQLPPEEISSTDSKNLEMY